MMLVGLSRKETRKKKDKAVSSLKAVQEPWEGYRSYPDRLNITVEVLERKVAEGLTGAPALLHERAILTYGELLRRVDAFAWSLQEIGVKRADLILIRMPNSPELAIAFLALVKIGVIPVLTNSLLGSGELSTILDQAKPRMIITEASRAAVIRDLQKRRSIEKVICAGGAEINDIRFESLLEHGWKFVESVDTAANDPAFIVYTSGTTGKPKGIVHAHRWIVTLGDLNRFRLPPKEGDVVMATGEWSFISALGHNLLFPLRNGVSGAILAGRPTSENILATIERYRVTVLYSVATVYRRLLSISDFERHCDLKSLRCANSTGEALREATYREWKRRVGCELYEHYGISEFQLVVGQGPRYPVKPGSIGKPLPGPAVAILDDDDKPVTRGEIGHMVITANDPGLFLGYYKDADRTETSIKDGWFRTGDLAYEDNEGYLFIVGRSDDCFKSRGILISPTEIENALQGHPAIVEAVVVPEPDREIGNRIRAFVVLGEGYNPSPGLAQSIREGLRPEMASFKLPHEIEFVPNLPKSPIGKILRNELTKGKREW